MLNFPSAHNLSNLGDDSLLIWFDGTIDSKDVGMHFWIFDDDSTHKLRQINNMNSWQQVISLPNNGQSGWVLNPSLLEVVIEDILAITIAQAGAEHMHSQERLGRNWGHGKRFKRLQVLVLLVGHSQVIVRLFEK